jgi:hypothetical protein
MTIEEIIKEAFSRGWNASHECATDFDYEYALNGFLSEVETEVKKFRIGAVGRSEQLCGNLNKNLNCKKMCLTHCIDGYKLCK